MCPRQLIKATSSCVRYVQQQQFRGDQSLNPPPPQSLIRVPEICLGGVAYLYEVLASLSDLSYGMEAKKEFRSWQLMKNTMSSTKRKSSRHMTM